MHNQTIKIAGVQIEPGEEKQIQLSISRLPTRTEINVPVTLNRSTKPGPTLLLMGGMHGDEINGVEIVRRIMAKKFHKPKIGSVICIPILNIYGFLNFSRQVPDGKDVNRSFPGTKNGSLASQIAYQLRSEILPLIDYGLDFHTGGARINNFPQIRGYMQDPVNKELADAFGSRFIINSPYRPKSLRRQASLINKNILVYEAGESLRLRKNAVDAGVEGALRVMKHLGMRDEAPAPLLESITIKSSSWVRASAAGLYHSFVRPGDSIEKNQTVGMITGPYGDFEKAVKSKTSGYVLSVNNIPVINRGDALTHVGQD